MQKSVTVSVRSLGMTAATAAAVLAAYSVGATHAQTSTAAAAPGAVAMAAPGDQASIVMTGVGEATGIPDQLTFEMGVQTTAADVSTALRTANGATRRVVRAVRGYDVAFKDVQTTGLSIGAKYDYSSGGPPVITGYSVTQRLSVLVRELPVAGAVISDAVDAGGNAVRLHDVRLQIGDTDALMREARAAAISQAQMKAEQYASAAGRALGEVSSVREVQVARGVDEAYLALDRAFAATNSVPIRPGSSDLAVTVSVIWSFA